MKSASEKSLLYVQERKQSYIENTQSDDIELFYSKEKSFHINTLSYDFIFTIIVEFSTLTKIDFIPSLPTCAYLFFQ